MTTYENSLLTALQEIIVSKNSHHLTDFTIICQNNGKEFKTHKLLLAARSKYFEAMFRQEPQKSSVKLDFEDKILEIILKSLVFPNLDDDGFNMEQLIQLLEVSDYLQMENFTSEVGIAVSKQLNQENIYDIFELSELFQSLSSPLGEKCAPYVRENLLEIDHEKIPISWFKLLPKFANNSCHFKDVQGRYLDPIQSELKLAVILQSQNPEENWDFPMTSKRKICFGLYDLTLAEIFEKHGLLNENHYNVFTSGLYYDKILRYALPYNLLTDESKVLLSSTLKEKYYQPGM